MYRGLSRLEYIVRESPSSNAASESGEDEREFEELLKREWEEFERLFGNGPRSETLAGLWMRRLT